MSGRTNGGTGGPGRGGSGLLIARGVARLALFRADGIALFTGSNHQVLTSLAPLLAFPAAFAVLALLGGGGLREFSELLSLVDALLLQLVLTEALARRWGREAEWGRYAVAVNWCQWVIPPVALVVVLVLRLLVGLGFPAQGVAPLGLLVLAVYALGLQWFIAKIGLRISGGRAALLVLGVNVCTALLVTLPTQLRLTLEA